MLNNELSAIMKHAYANTFFFSRKRENCISFHQGEENKIKIFTKCANTFQAHTFD